MHASSLISMEEFIKKHMPADKNVKILDVGSMDVTNGLPNYKDLLTKHGYLNYTGLDISIGKNVDIVATSLYNWGVSAEYDVVISGQCLEHVKDTKEWILQVEKALVRGGTVCIIAPWQWKEHRYPVDCWRILPDGMRFLLEDVCHFEIVSIYKQAKDCIGIAKKK